MKTFSIKDLISLKPCPDWTAERMQSLFGERKRLSFKAIMGLEIEHNEKIWFGVRLLPVPLRVKFAAGCARRVLHNYEAAYPDDPRVRLAIEAAENHNITSAAARSAAADVSAARSAGAAAAAAGAAAAFAAAAAARYAAALVTAAGAARSAERAAWYAEAGAAAAAAERAWQIAYLIELHGVK